MYYVRAAIACVCLCVCTENDTFGVYVLCTIRHTIAVVIVALQALQIIKLNRKHYLSVNAWYVDCCCRCQTLNAKCCVVTGIVVVVVRMCVQFRHCHFGRRIFLILFPSFAFCNCFDSAFYCQLSTRYRRINIAWRIAYPYLCRSWGRCQQVVKYG